MYLIALKFAFLIISLLLVVFIVLQKTVVYKIKDSKKTSPFIASMALLFFLYIACAFILALIVHGIVNRIILLLFSISPFLIGRFATYKKETFFSMLQIFCVLFSMLFVYLI